jgi:MFS family permease
MGQETQLRAPLAVPQRPVTHGKLFYGWWIVLAAGLGLGLGYAPIVVFSFGIFLQPLVQEFHSSRASVALAFTVASLAHALTTPRLGRWSDRIGAKPVILTGTFLFAATLASFVVFATSVWKIYLIYLLLGIAGSGPAPVPYGKIIANWFDRRRGLALGLTMFGLGLGAIAMPYVAQRLILLWGWRLAYGGISVLVAAVSVPVLVLVLKENPIDTGDLPDGDRSAQAISTAERVAAEGVSWPEARRDPTFWIIAGAVALVGMSVQGCVVHIAPMLADRGVTAERAAFASSVLGGALLIGRVVSGYLLDRVFAPRVATFFFVAAALGIASLLNATSSGSALVGAMLIGLGVGAEVDIIAYLTSRYFGLRSFGEIYGYAFAAYVLAGALGPWFMGLGFDHAGSYGPVLAGFLAATIVGAAMIQKLGSYRYRAH